MPKLPSDWADHLRSGASTRLGSRHADGRPEICRGLGAHARADGLVEVLVNVAASQELLVAVSASRLVSYVSSQPDTNRTLHVKGINAEVVAPTDTHADLLTLCRDRFVERVRPFGFTRDVIVGFWYEIGLEQIAIVRFSPEGAWDQSPGPGAGQAVQLLP